MAIAADRIFLDTLVERCASFSSEARVLVSLNYPSEAPRTLAKCLHQASQRSSLRSEELRKLATYQGPIPLDEILAEASNIYDFIAYQRSIICPMLRNATIVDVPAEIVLPMERIARLVFPDCKLVIGAVPEQNYYYREIGKRIYESFENLDIEDILTAVGGFPENLFRLQVCSDPPCGILMHCILGHEIGHALYEQLQLAQRLVVTFDDQTLDALVEDQFQQLLAGSPVDPGIQPEQLLLPQTRSYMKYLMNIHLRLVAGYWMREIFCDTVGIGLFGPAFICASSLFLLPFETYDEGSDRYPPSRLRIQISINALKRADPGFGYRRLRNRPSESLLNALIQPWEELVGKKPVSPIDHLYRVVFKKVYGMRKNIVKEAKSAVGSASLSSKIIEDEVPWLRERLKDWLPPNEYQTNLGEEFTTASLQGMLNAGWLSYIEDMAYFLSKHKRLSEIEIKRKFNGLLSKGIESSEIKAQWERARHNLGIEH